MGTIRLDKFLANAGCGTRSEVKALIRKGRVSVDGAVCKTADQKLDLAHSLVCLDEKPVSYAAHEYYMLHKAAGCVTAARDSRYPTVMDGIRSSRKEKLFPVGRLDLDTEGLLLITDDGELAHRLLSPANHVEKTYFAKVKGAVSAQDIQLFAQGVDIGEKRPTLPAKLEILCSGEVSEVFLTIQEGKFHQVKRMFQAVQKEVLYLKRVRMGSLVLDETLEKGAYRALTEEEIAALREEAVHE